MRTEVTELPDSRVRVEAAVEPAELAKRMEHAARELARDMRLPGFRKGKVPPELVIQRVGREAVLDEALRSSIPEWYERALLEAGISPVGDPKLDVPKLPAEGEELEFSIEVAVRPKAQLGDYKGLEVGRAEPGVPEEAIQAELDRLREGFASLNPVERPAAEGDVVLIDYSGTIDGEPFEGSEASDFLVELGGRGLLPEFDQALTGTSAGDQRTIEVTFPEDHRPAELAGKTASFAVTVKEIREKKLPALDDEFASDASEFETLAELREEIGQRMATALEQRAEADFREATVDAAAEAAKMEIPAEIVDARAEEMVDRLLHRLSHQGIEADAFLRVQPGGREGMVAEAKSEAERGLRREATLEAVADAEGIEVGDEELLEALPPGEGEDEPRRILERLRETGRDEMLRQDLRLRRAASVIADSAKPIPLEQAAAREKLWTPEKERDEKGGLWTPGQ